MNLKSLLASFLLAGIVFSAIAQQPDLNQKMPIDPTVKIGKLSNGLTYYLKENPKPEKRLWLQLAINAGSVNENDSQQGLAHFMEHMCFNGTKSWKKNDMINMLETMGVRFGDGLNASTSYDQTIYMLEIPTDKPENIEKGFQVMEEWAHLVSLEDGEIEKERGVILEERRLRLGAYERMRRQYEPVLLKGSRYAERFIIGKEEVLKTFPPDTLRSFYKSWYRPDNMALIVVGDIDLKQMEKKMKSHFAKIPKAKGNLNRVEYDVPGNKDPLISIVTDKEAMAFSVQVYFKYPAFKVKTIGEYRKKLTEQLYNTMFSKRLSEIGMKPETPYINASAYTGSFYSRLTNAYSVMVSAKENKISESLSLVMTENERVRQHGFTQAELDREKKAIITNLESAVKEADKVESDSWASRCLSNFLTESLLMNPAQNQDIVKSLLPGIGLDDINKLAKELITSENIAAVVLAPEKEGTKLPTESEVIGIIKSVKDKKLDPYVDNMSDAPLLAEKPKAGEIMKKVENKEAGVTEVTFSNGATVVLKSTDFKNDEINFSAYSPGGLSLLSDNDLITGQMAASVMQQGGLGDFDMVSLRKKLTGIRASAGPSISELTENMQGSSNVKDFETMLQLNYLWFTKPRKDPEAFKSLIDKIKNSYKNITANPQFIFMDSLTKLAYARNPRAIIVPTVAQLDAITLDKAYDILTDRIKDASDFKFFFVGSFKIDEIMPLLQVYIGGLPSIHRNETFKDVAPVLVDRVIDEKMAINSEPQSMVIMFFDGKFDYTDSEQLLFSIMMQTMNIKLREQMREEQGGVYGVSFQESLSKFPKQWFEISANWGCAPEKVDTLTQTLFGEMERIKKEGPTEVDLAKIKETIIKDYEKNIKQNYFWISSLQDFYLNGNEIYSLDEYTKTVEAVTIQDIKRTADKYLDSKQYIRGVLMPKK
ncbi:MAG: insulinase family protein [Bacteroidia bacterium]|nr:insulinase family protein [Bacteroidia bacterium]